jgi:hypothetical protein
MTDQQTDACTNTNCDEPTPWDMAAVMLDDEWFCSPACAREYLNESDATPSTVTLHDPQFVASRAEMPASVDDADVDIQRRVTDRDDAFSAIDELVSMFSAPFRVVIDE